MNKLFKTLPFIFFLLVIHSSFAQEVLSSSNDNYRGPKTLNIGINTGFGAYNIGVQADYEIGQIGQDFTIGASVAFQNWNTASYKGASFAFGARVRWYGDRVLQITDPKWDVFANGDLGFNINAPSALWWGIGLGGKYHINEKFGLQAIIGTGAQFGMTIQL